MKAEKPARISFVDIGFEDADRLKELSVKPLSRPKSFLGIEAPKKEGEFASDTANLELRRDGVIHELAKLPDGSVNVVNADFSLFSGFYAVDPPSRATISPTEAYLAGADPEKINGFFNEEKLKALQEIRRVLPPNGRLYITEYARNMGEVEALLTEAGYTFETRKIPWEELDRTATMQELRKDLESGKADPEKMQPYRIAARKRLNA